MQEKKSVLLVMPEKLFDRVKEWQEQQLLSSTTQAIIQLIQKGLKEDGQGTGVLRE